MISFDKSTSLLDEADTTPYRYTITRHSPLSASAVRAKSSSVIVT
jgi:hypothetical protein